MHVVAQQSLAPEPKLDHTETHHLVTQPVKNRCIAFVAGPRSVEYIRLHQAVCRQCPASSCRNQNTTWAVPTRLLPPTTSPGVEANTTYTLLDPVTWVRTYAAQD